MLNSNTTKFSNLHALSMPRHQQGLVLVVSLIFLLLMTLIGITSIRTSTMEERMAGNSRDQNLAFMAAETGLRDAETALEDFASTSVFGAGTSNGYYDLTHDADYTLAATWEAGDSITATAIPGVATAPRYYIKMAACISNTSGAQSLSMQGYGKTGVTGDTQIFRVTARGTGGTNNTSKMVRTHYGKVLGSC